MPKNYGFCTARCLHVSCLKIHLAHKFRSWTVMLFALFKTNGCT